MPKESIENLSTQDFSFEVHQDTQHTEKELEGMDFASVVVPRVIPSSVKNQQTNIPNPLDHCYTDRKLKPKKPTAEEVENRLYKETIDELKSIKNGVNDISANLADLTTVLREIKEILLKNNK